MSTHTGGETTNSGSSNWPLHKISEPHEFNDVLLSIPETNNSNNPHHSETSSSEEPPIPEEEPPIPWRSIPLNSHKEVSASVKGNQRLFELLLRHQEDYDTRPKMEKPLVTVRVLQEWRSQSPPGRFLEIETETNPPLWKDIGDKKARSKISKALKHLTKTQGSASVITGTRPEPANSSGADVAAGPTFVAQESAPMPDNMPSAVEVIQAKQVSSTLRCSSDVSSGSLNIRPKEEESKVSQEGPNLITSLIEGPAKHSIPSEIPVVHRSITIHQEHEEKKACEPLPNHHTPSNLQLPRIPARFRQPEKYVRRISEQLHSAQEDGSIYGRWRELGELMTIYERQKQQQSVVDLVLISGLMGVGKTSLAETLRNPLVDDDDYGYESNDEDMEWPFLLHGKFEPCQWSDPNEFFVAIVADFCHQLGKRNDPALTRKYRNALVEELKDDIILLGNLVPALDALLKSPHRSSVPCGSMDDSNNACCPREEQAKDDSFACMAMQRIKGVFGKFLQIIASVSPEKHPVIVLLDDLHWASEPACDIITSLATNRSNAGVLFIGTFRDDEADERHFKKALMQWDRHQNVNVTSFHLGNLKEDSVHLMLADALSLQEGETQTLNELVYSLTKGNPTFITELLRVFQDKGLLRFEASSQQWTCDLEQIPSMLGSIDGVPDLFKAKVLELPPVIQETLKIAACLWSTEIDEKILKMIDTVGTVSSHLKFADIRGLLKYRNGQYAFVSDGVKQAIYDLIPVGERGSYHLKIGQRLWLHLEENQNSNFFSLLMSQMMMGDDMITADEDRRAVASLCLQAGRLAAKYLGFQTAWLCLSHGISIVSAQKTWGRENYDLSLSLHNTAMEVCYCNGEFKELQNLIDEVLENARTFEDSLLARSTQIYSLGSSNKQMDAIKLGLQTLKQLGENFRSMHPSRLRVLMEARKLKSLLRNMSDKDILKLPRMKDPKKLAAMQIMNHFILYTVYATPNLSALVAFRMVELTVKCGLCAMSSVGFVLYGTMLCRFDAIDEGFRYGKLALKIAESFKKAIWVCRTWAGYYGTVHSRKRSIHEVIEPLRTAYRAGMRTGDVEFSCLNACLVCWNNCELMTLPELEAELRDVGGQMDYYGQTLSLVMLKPLWQASLNFMGKADGDPKFLQGKLIDEDVELAKTVSSPHFVSWIEFFRMKVAYIFGDYDLAGQYTSAAPEIYNYSNGAMDCVYTMTYECLTLLALARRGKRRLRTIFYVKRRLKRMKFWAMHAPMNFLGKQLLVEAELAALCDDRQKAISRYRSSILHSREEGFMLEEALANEQLGRFYLESNDEESAVPFLHAAREVYKKWGATAKVNYFETEFGELLEMKLADLQSK